ncbi:MAG: 30S ribosomal protein S4 [Candidatus Nanoarchaeia archaeon]|nr:30S ribosomal protein S4 [Candidatus Nanoarchaeia archaeon]
MRKLKPKYTKPRHPWEKMRIIEEKNLKKEYWYKNKKEMWKMRSILKNFREQARTLIGSQEHQAEKQKKQLLEKLNNLGILTKKDAGLDDVLGLSIKDIMERRLQTLVYRKKLSNTIKESRQKILHGKVFIGDKKTTAPSKLVSVDEEKQIKGVE